MLHRLQRNFQLSLSISTALTQIVSNLTIRPHFLIAKGGITSSDIATHSLGIRKAEILGQAAKGVPVWKSGPESKFPGMPYIVFPGNVGETDTLTNVVKRCLKGSHL